MNRQSLSFMREPGLPKYGDPNDHFEKGRRYVYRKQQWQAEPPKRSRALRSFSTLLDALTWARNNLGADFFAIVSI